MRTCVIFNPAAKGQKAARLRARLNEIALFAALKRTSAPGDARKLAAEAIREGCDTVIAAGGDGTVNEVLNGIGDAAAFNRVRLGVLPLGTMNVFAREMKIPLNVTGAWELVRRGRYTRIDLPWAEFSGNGVPQRRYFVQLAGVGLDARAIELVDSVQKKKLGALAYVAAGWKALSEPQPEIAVTAGEEWFTGKLVLIGNGRLYGGWMRVFPNASLRDGELNICIFARAGRLTTPAYAAWAAAFWKLPENGLERWRAAEFTVGAVPGAGVELDGEFAGRTPVKFGLEKEALRVIVP